MNNLGAFKGLQVGALAAGMLVAGCAAMPVTEPVAEKLDPDTATTVTVLSTPIELFAQTSKSKQTDPFAYIAPFETNRMGSKECFCGCPLRRRRGPSPNPKSCATDSLWS